MEKTQALRYRIAPLEAGCALVRTPELLRNAFSYHPPYYHFDEDTLASINYYEYGLQNSRGFRALKVWLALTSPRKCFVKSERFPGMAESMPWMTFLSTCTMGINASIVLKSRRFATA